MAISSPPHLIFFSVFFTMNLFDHVRSQCLEDQKSLLLEVKNELVFNSSYSQKLVRWNETETDDDCCNWDGVGCDDAGRVISLQLDDESIYGGLDGSSSSLFRLIHLEKLSLNTNNFSAATNLDFFANFSSLTTLSLRGCSVKGSFPKVLLQIPTLRELDLSYNEFGGTLTQFPESKVRSLSMSGCNFVGPIPSTLGNLTELVHLDLMDNLFTGSLSNSHFEGLSKLVNLYLSFNLLSGSIPPSLFGLPSLRYLWLNNNKFSGKINEFPTVNTSKLWSMYLDSNELEGPVPDSFFRIRSLVIMDLSNNLFNDTFQLEKIQGVPNLQILDLSYNKLSVEATNSNSSLYGFDHQLYSLSLASCNLYSFPHFIRQSSLEVLDLSSNNIAGEIPSWIWEIGNGKLPDLNLSCNQLVDLQKPYHIPTSLQRIDLHSNMLRGELPPLSRVASRVDYSYNFFDKFSPNAGSLSAPGLLYLSLANNSLSGSFPAFICNFTKLQILDLYINTFSGSFPTCLLEDMEDLQVLNLGRNNISGPIPDRFSLNCRIKTLDLSHNVLTGDVPISLANCNSLVVMNVGTNLIDDTFPCMLPSSLQVLVLRSNRFHGEIICDESWPNLQIIDIASNNLTGYLNAFNFSGWRGMMRESGDADEELTRTNLGVQTRVFGYYYQDEVMLIIKGLGLKLDKIWPEFTSIDLSCNNFKGDIPDSIGKLNALYLLNLSHNSLTGTIPKSFSSLKQLGSMDLSVNQLTGEIPRELAGLTFLQVMNLSYNKLVGKIPIGPQLQTFSADPFQGNTGLCGLPLNIRCTSSSPPSPPGLHGSNDVYYQSDGKTTEIEWGYVLAALGYVVGLGSIVWLLLCCRSFREKYFEKVDYVCHKIFNRHQHRN